MSNIFDNPYDNPYGENLFVRQNQMRFGFPDDVRRYVDNLNSVLGAEVGEITSREQIIDPYALIDVSNYRNTKKGQALYNADLERAKMYAERQEAAYQEWFNSEAQQAARQRDAGLNPDLIGVEPSAAADTQQAEGSPIDGIGTTGDTIATAAGIAVTTIGTVVSAIATLGALPATIGAALATAGAAVKQANNLEANTNATNLATLKSAEDSYEEAIINQVADARDAALASGAEFDEEAYLSDDANFANGLLETYAPVGFDAKHPQYSQYVNALSRARNKRRRIAAESAKINKDADSGQLEWLKIRTDPRVSSSDRLSMATMIPLSRGYFELEKKQLQFAQDVLDLKNKYIDSIDPEDAAEAFNLRNQAAIAESTHNRDYYNEYDGAYKAKLDKYLKDAEVTIKSTSAMINKHYRDIWLDESKSFTERQGALFMIMDGVARKSRDFLIAQFFSDGGNVMGVYGDEFKAPNSSAWDRNSSFSERILDYIGRRQMDL